ncbi:MAG: YdeI/OmpD-associated family protein [Chloroherpetonaceae bacterium]|nr:YdeI/OmpD-associated family protein [Chloroherpetonaceae bacterium]
MKTSRKPEMKDGVLAVEANSAAAWRAWLQAHHQTHKSVWLIIYRKESGIPSVYYPEAVDEALCFGWVDSKPNKRDDVSYYQFFAKRNPKSNWSAINKKKVERLIAEGKMMPAGLEMVALAKQTGTWEALEKVDALILPEDLLSRFQSNQVAYSNWEKFPPSSKRGILEWIQAAKKVETRTKRIDETVSLAEKNIKANHYRQ